MQKTNCPDMDYVDNKCPGNENVKCCLSVPYQEPECEAEGGSCGPECSCQGELLSGYCPKQPGPIKCCIEEELVESCSEETTTTSPSECVDKKISRISDCTSDTVLRK